MTQLFRSATFKLTVWYLAVVASISFVFSIVVYHFAMSELQSGLTHQTLRIYKNFPVFSDNPLLQDADDITAGSHHIIWHLIYFNVLVLLLAGIASYYLARRTLQPIEAAHKRQQRFTADVSHELRTPLTSLKMNTEVTLMDKTNSKQVLREALASNLEDANQMERLINNLLRLTRLDADAVQAQFGPIQANVVINEALTQLKPLADSKHIAIHVTDTTYVVLGDHDSLVQLLVILLDNAIKYSSVGKTVEISTQSLTDMVQLTVQDHGPGISPEALPHVFDRFYRADSSRNKTIADGFGLGLSIAKLISDTHGGTITLNSRPNHGTCAIITLPAAPITAASDKSK